MPASDDFSRTAPKIGVPFLKAFRIRPGAPAGLLGRFFLIANERMGKRGITLEFASFQEVAAVQAANVENWPDMNPMFDSRVSGLPAPMFCLVGRDSNGRIIATCCGKQFDARERPLSQLVEDGDYYALKPGALPDMRAVFDSAEAQRMHGLLGYSGGLWIHPDFRHLRLPAVFCRLVTATMLALWDTDLILGAVAKELDGTDYARRYGYAHEAPMLKVFNKGIPSGEYVLLWMTPGDTAVDLARFVDVLWPEIDAAVATRGAKQSA